MEIEIIYYHQNQCLYKIQISIRNNSTVLEALQQSGILNLYPEVLEKKIGIFSKPTTLDTLLQPEDRIEIYQPLIYDPKERRRRKLKNNTL